MLSQPPVSASPKRAYSRTLELIFILSRVISTAIMRPGKSVIEVLSQA